MNKTQKWNEWIQDLNLDIRLEVILAELVDDGRSMDDIVIISNSLFRRSYHRDIEKAEEIPDTVSRRTKLQVTVNRDGLYDLLPEDLFHQPPAPDRPMDSEKNREEMKKQAEIEIDSRLFFQPFEQEFYRQRVRLEKQERGFLFETNSDLSAGLPDELWHLPAFMDERQKSMLGVLMPVLNQLAGDWELVTAVMENVTGDRVQIREAAPLESILPEGLRWNEARLGDSTVLGGVLREMQTSLIVTILLPGPGQLAEYMPGGRKIRIFESLAGFLVPLEIDVVFELNFASQMPFELKEDHAYSGRLNYTTTL